MKLYQVRLISESRVATFSVQKDRHVPVAGELRLGHGDAHVAEGWEQGALDLLLKPARRRYVVRVHPDLSVGQLALQEQGVARASW